MNDSTRIPCMAPPCRSHPSLSGVRFDSVLTPQSFLLPHHRSPSPISSFIPQPSSFRKPSSRVYILTHSDPLKHDNCPKRPFLVARCDPQTLDLPNSSCFLNPPRWLAPD